MSKYRVNVCLPPSALTDVEGALPEPRRLGPWPGHGPDHHLPPRRRAQLRTRGDLGRRPRRAPDPRGRVDRHQALQRRRGRGERHLRAPVHRVPRGPGRRLPGRAAVVPLL